MLYNYGAILDFDPLSYRGALEYFDSKRANAYAGLEIIETVYSGVQEVFDIFHPNITFQVGQFEFNKESYSIDLGNSISLLMNNTSSTFESSGDPKPVHEKTVLLADRVLDAKEYFDTVFLSRDSSDHTVYWLYDMTSTDLQFITGHIFNDSDILPSSVTEVLFYKKRNEAFNDLFVLSHDVTNQESVVYKGMLETEFNNTADYEVQCNALNLTGQTVYSKDGDINFTNTMALSTRIASFSNSYIHFDMSPVSTDYASLIFISKDLSNASSFMVVDSVHADRSLKEVISLSNFNEVLSDILEIDAEFIDDSYKINVSSGGNALNFSKFYSLLAVKLNSFYADQLKLFLDGYTNSGALGELLKYIIDKIESLKNKFVAVDECVALPINNIDEGCNIPCDQIYLDEPKLMVSKQKLKSMIRCSLNCERIV